MNSPVIAYHGCDVEVAKGVVTRKLKLQPGKGRYDWLGSGIYFWEDDPNLALGWAKHTARRRPDLIQNPAVIGAVIELTECLNLVQTGASRILHAAYNTLVQEVQRAGAQMPENESEERRFLDHAVFETLHELRDKEKRTAFAPVRAVFQSGEPVFPGSSIRKWDHIQICVRDLSVVKGCFWVHP